MYGTPEFKNVSPSEESNCRSDTGPNRSNAKPAEIIVYGPNGVPIGRRQSPIAGPPKPPLLKHQKVVADLLSRPTSSQEFLVLHDTGTGKTAIMTELIDNNMMEVDGKYVVKDRYEKIIIIVPEDALKLNVITESRKYSRGVLKKILGAIPSGTKQPEIERVLRAANIHFMTYAEAGKSVKQYVPPEMDSRIAEYWDKFGCDSDPDVDVKNATMNCWFLGYVTYVARGWAMPQFFSNSIILLDEIHNIVSPSQKIMRLGQSFATLTLKYFFMYRNAMLSGPFFDKPTPPMIYRNSEWASMGLGNGMTVTTHKQRYSIGRPSNIKFIGFTATPVMNGGQDLFTLVNILKGDPGYVNVLDYIAPNTAPDRSLFELAHGEWIGRNASMDPFAGRKLTNRSLLKDKLAGVFSVYRKDWDTTRFPLVSGAPYIHLVPYSSELEKDLQTQKVKNGSQSISNKGRFVLRNLKGNQKSEMLQLTSKPTEGTKGKTYLKRDSGCGYTIRNVPALASHPKNTPIFVTGLLTERTSAKIGMPKLTLKFNGEEDTPRDIYDFMTLVRSHGGDQNTIFRHISPKLYRFIAWASSTESLRVSSGGMIRPKSKQFAYCFNPITLEALGLMLIRSGWTYFIPPKVCYAASEAATTLVTSIQIESTEPMVGWCKVYFSGSSGRTEMEFDLISGSHVTTKEFGAPVAVKMIRILATGSNIEVVLLNEGGTIWSNTVRAGREVRLYPSLAADEIETYYATMSPHPKRFMLLHDGMDSDVAKAFIDFFNHKRNRHGDYIHMIIMSSSFKEGITLKDVRQVHFIDTPKSMTEIIQALGRASRVCSFQNLDKSEWKIFWHIWMHVLRGEGEKVRRKTPITDFISPEPRMWLDAKKQYKLVSELLDFLGQVAVDCNVHKLVSGLSCL